MGFFLEKTGEPRKEPKWTGQEYTTVHIESNLSLRIEPETLHRNTDWAARQQRNILNHIIALRGDANCIHKFAHVHNWWVWTRLSLFWNSLLIILKLSRGLFWNSIFYFEIFYLKFLEFPADHSRGFSGHILEFSVHYTGVLGPLLCSLLWNSGHYTGILLNTLKFRWLFWNFLMIIQNFSRWIVLTFTVVDFGIFGIIVEFWPNQLTIIQEFSADHSSVSCALFLEFSVHYAVILCWVLWNSMFSTLKLCSLCWNSLFITLEWSTHYTGILCWSSRISLLISLTFTVDDLGIILEFWGHCSGIIWWSFGNSPLITPGLFLDLFAYCFGILCARAIIRCRKNGGFIRRLIYLQTSLPSATVSSSPSLDISNPEGMGLPCQVCKPPQMAPLDWQNRQLYQSPHHIIET